MYFSRIALFALPALAVATNIPRNDDDGSNTCVQGTSQFCCNSLQSANQLSADAKTVFAFFGFNVDNVAGQFGFACNPVTLAGAYKGGAAAFGTSGCNGQTTCCQQSAANGFLAANCNSVIGNL